MLRSWSREDFHSIRNILLITWKDAYHFIPEKDITAHLEKYYSESKLIELFEDPKAKGIIAEVQNKPVGWMKLFDDQMAERYYVSSLYVLPESQGMGMGKKLLDKAEQIALKNGYDKIWLGVLKQNLPALEWYNKIGFSFVEEEPFKMGQTEVMHLIGYKIIG